MSCYEQVGQFSVATSVSIQRRNVHEHLDKGGGNVVTYFCTPAKDVLLYLVGPVSAEELLKGAQFANRLNQKLLGLDKTQQARTIREAHEEALLSEVRTPFDRWRENQDGFDRRTVAQRLNATVLFVDQLQKELSAARPIVPRQASKFQLEQSEKFFRRIAEIDRNEPHAVLAAISPITLREIQAPVFERLAGQKFIERTQRNKDLLATVQDNAKAARPTVLVVTDHHRVTPSDAQKIPKHRDLEGRDDFGIVSLTKLELVRLMDDTDHDPIENISGFETRYVVLDVTGQRVSTIGLSSDGRFRALRQNRERSPSQSGGSGLLLQALELAQRSD